MENWGEIRLQKIDNCYYFWALYDEMCKDQGYGYGWISNTMLDAYKDGNLYGLLVPETEKMYRAGSYGDIGSHRDPIFAKESGTTLLPIFCIKEKQKEKNIAVYIWTHPRARKMGFAKKLVKLLNIEYADDSTPDSIGFWKKCNIEQKDWY